MGRGRATATEQVVGPVPPLVRVLGPCTVDLSAGSRADRSRDDRSRDDRSPDARGQEPSPIQRRLLARLAAARPHPVSVGVLAEAVWAEDAPRTAKASLLNQVSRLRRTFGSEIVTTTAEGYVLGIPTDLDAVAAAVVEGEAALQAGDHDRAGRVLTGALDQWRGRAFADLEHVVEVEAARRRAHELRHAAENLRLVAALRDGRHGFAVPEAERLVAHAPNDEQRWALLAQALDLAGRRGDALSAFDRARRTLRDGLGLDPGPVLRSAEAALLGIRHDRADSRARRVVGREPVLQALVEAVGSGRCVVVRGEAGCGASTVLDELVRRLRGEVLVAHTRCVAAPATPVSALAELLEQLGETDRRIQGMVEQFVVSVRELADERRVVLVVDDLHLAGPSTVAALGTVADVDGVAVVAASREPVAGLGGGEDDGRQDDGWDEVHLGPLDASAVATIARELTGNRLAPTDADLDWLATMSGGNPLFLQSLLEAPGRSPLDTDAPEDEPSIDGSLAEHVRTRLDRLGSTTRGAVEVAAVAGAEFPMVVLDELAPPSGTAAAVAAGLLVVEPGHQVRFRHGAVRHVVELDLPPGRRMEIHDAVGRLLDRRGFPATSVAPHLLAARDVDPAAAVDAARRAAREATSVGAHRDAAAWFERAAAAAELLGTPGEGDLVACLVGQGDALRLAGDPDQERVLTEAVDRAFATGDPSLVADAAFAVLQLGFTTATGRPHELGLEVADRALAMARDADDRARVAAAASLGISMSGASDRCRELFLSACAEPVSEPVRRRILPFAYMALGSPGDLDRRAELGAELLELGTAAGDLVACFEARHLSFSVALQRGDGDAVREHLREMIAMVDEVGDVGRRWALLYQMAAVAHLDDELDRSERLSDDALSLFSPVSASRSIAVHGAQLLAIRHAQGRLAELADVFAMVVDDQPEVPAWHAALSLALVGVDDPRSARHARAVLREVPEDFMWLAAHVIGGRAAAAVGDRSVAAGYVERLAPWSGRACWQGTCSYGPVDTVLAALHRCRGDDAAAADHAARALDVARRLGAPVFERELAELGLLSA